MKKKVVGTLLCVAMTTTLLAGCGSSSDDSSTEETEEAAEEETEETAEEETEEAAEEETTEEASSDEQITLRVAWWGSQDRHDRTIEAIELYESLNPNVTIEYEYYSYDDYYTKLKTLVASDEVWDVFQLTDNYPAYMDKIYPLDEFIESGVVDTSDIDDAYLYSTQAYDGSIAGLALGVNTYALMYDPDMFEEAGVEIPDENWTWDDYQAAADAITDALGIYGSSYFSSDGEWIYGCELYIPLQGDEEGQYNFYNKELTGMGFDDPQMLTGYIQMRADMMNNGSYPDMGTGNEITGYDNDFFTTGEAAMGQLVLNNYPYIYDLLQEQGRTAAITTVPKYSEDGNSASLVRSSQMFSVSQDSDYKEEAAAFISWFVNDMDCNAILEGERGIPINNSVREALYEEATEGQQLMYDFMDTIAESAVAGAVNCTWPDGNDEVEDNYKNYIQQVMNGEITAEEAAEQTYADAAAIFE